VPKFTCEQYSPGANYWSFIAAPSTPTGYLAMATLNERAYVFGGYSTHGETADVFMYDGITWQPRTPMPRPVHKHSASVTMMRGNYLRTTTLDPAPRTISQQNENAYDIIFDHALICGGCLGDEMLATCYIYDALLDSWTRVRDMLQPRWSHSAVASGNGCKNILSYIYVILFATI
jgi:hypothetical protein